MYNFIKHLPVLQTKSVVLSNAIKETPILSKNSPARLLEYRRRW